MIEFLDVETYTLTYQGKQWDLRKDLESLEGANGRQKTYIRRPNKIAIYKELSRRYPEIYEDITKYGWFEQYRSEVEGVTTHSENEGEMNMNTEVLEKLMKGFDNLSKSIDSISDEHRINFAKEDMKNWVMDFMKKEYPNLPKTLDVRVSDAKINKIEGVTHRIFPKVCKLVNMHKPVMLSGPAGTGKNYMVEQIAKALDLNFYYSSTITQEYKLTGFIDASGNYHTTELRRAMEDEKGALFMIDEIDASVPETLVVINSVLANGYFDFPDKRVTANPNFHVICAGNTVGLGADMVYTGRNVIDGATLDRFVLVKMDYDKSIEEALCPDEELKSFIYDVRKSAQKNHINCIVGMRCLKYAYEMLANDFDKQDIVSDAIIKGLQEDDINVLKNDLDSSSPWYKYFKYVA